ncbi:uncharacterized protein [Spinacia oleracea]|uniref:SWIM-type domain-containing protein n=1 Tax=Spinacia oleracea TaxID=3562 RepID=A0ABM3QZ27_SPIOL|nr:uncharacterized protein LOC130463498 [Spinacia oleracea]
MVHNCGCSVEGFLGGCRPLIGVDGCHLKGNYGGILLSAIALDNNNEIFPLAFAIVSVEDKETWSFFFWRLYNILKDSNRSDWTIISDRQKGVDLALKDVWPAAKRRYCCRHLSRNYKREFPGPAMYIMFWRVCNATSAYSFRKAMERLQKVGGKPVMTWFAKLGKQEKWSKHKFDPNVCCDSNTSNFVESFNSTLGVDRCRPVLTLLEGIRRVCMVRISTRHQNSMGWDNDGICPKIVKMLKQIGKESSSCRAYMSRPGEYEIHEGKSQFPLSLNDKICSCGAWQISGVPCRHAIRAMVDAKLDLHKFVSSWFSVKTYKKIYNFNIIPLPDRDQWLMYENLPTIKPPRMKRGVGRPCRNRRREEGEEQPGKRSKTVKCHKCGCFGHNSRTCKGAKAAEKAAKAAEKAAKAAKVAEVAAAVARAADIAARTNGSRRGKAPARESQQANSQMSTQPT